MKKEKHYITKGLALAAMAGLSKKKVVSNWQGRKRENQILIIESKNSKLCSKIQFAKMISMVNKCYMFY